MEKLKSHLKFNKQQRGGILFLIFLIISLQILYLNISFSSETTFDSSSSKIIQLQQSIDSLQVIALQKRIPKIYPFNPNFITDYKGYTLGMASEEIDRLHKFRASNKWINSISDFKRVTKVSDSLLNKISPFFKFPDWVTNPKRKSYNTYKDVSEKTFAQKIDLNKATLVQLQKVSGIGPALSKRIVSYREKLGGFINDSQLYNVYGLNQQVVKRALNEFTVKTPKQIILMDINKVSASDLSTIPGLSFDMAVDIVTFRKLHEGIKTFEELTKIQGVTSYKIKGFQLYLRIE